VEENHKDIYEDLKSAGGYYGNIIATGEVLEDG
jgi:hypothetical protein